MPSNHLIFCHPLLLLPTIFPSVRVFSNELTLRIWWPKYWSFYFSFPLSFSSHDHEKPGYFTYWKEALLVSVCELPERPQAQLWGVGCLDNLSLLSWQVPPQPSRLFSVVPSGTKAVARDFTFSTHPDHFNKQSLLLLSSQCGWRELSDLFPGLTTSFPSLSPAHSAPEPWPPWCPLAPQGCCYLSAWDSLFSGILSLNVCVLTES